MKFNYITALGLLPLVSAAGLLNLDYNVKYYLYTKLNPSTPQELNSSSVQNSSFNPLKRTKIIVHGYHENATDPLSSSQRLLQGYICNGADLNYLIISYNSTITGTNVDYVLVNFDQIVQEVGNIINTFLTFLKTNFNLKNNQFDLVCHSLGAQICAILAQLQPLIDKFLNFFALDPAGPFYQGTPPQWRVSRTDAINVEQTVSSCTFGTYFPEGRAVIYINDGICQPHCQGVQDILCNHQRSVDVFAKATCQKTGFSCVPCSFAGILYQLCPSTPQSNYGDEPNVVRNGLFELVTNYKPDYIPTTNLLSG